MKQSSFKIRLIRLLVGRERDLGSEDSRRDAMVVGIATMACFVLLGVAAASGLRGELFTAGIDFLAGLLLATIVLIFRFTSYKRVCLYVGVVLMYTLYMYLFFSGAADGNTYMWHYTFPFFAIFLLGSRHGAIATLLLFAGVFSGVIYDALTDGLGFYSTQFAIRFLPSVSVALVFAYLFERERERFRRQTLRAYQEQERIIEERTSQLIERVAERDKMAEKLRQSQKMEAIGTMASGVAHDLNNILSGVVTYPELLRSDLPEGSPLAEGLKVIEQAGKRAAAVVSDLLTIARNAVSVKEEFDINTLIRELLDSPEWLVMVEEHPDVNIHTGLEADSSIIKSSQTHIRKCLLNLLVNGIEASPKKGNVFISTRNTPGKESEDVAITVMDDGPGIATEHLEHIFEPFYTTKKMGSSGSGLGLSVVWNTVEEHGGSVSVENIESGVQFILKFPVRAGSLVTREKQAHSLEYYEGRGSILVVDDEPQLRKLAEAIVRKLGYSVNVVATGEEALLYMKDNPVDLVLLDMILGTGISGFETYQRMVALHPGQKAIIVSGYSSSQEARQTMEIGAHSIVKKPYTIEGLGRAIKDCLKSDSQH